MSEPFVGIFAKWGWINVDQQIRTIILKTHNVKTSQRQQKHEVTAEAAGEFVVFLFCFNIPLKIYSSFT